MPCVAAAASIDPAVEESLRQQQRQIQLEQQRLQREQREREQRRNAPPLELGTSEAPATTQVTAEGPCQNIQQIKLAGASLIKKNQSDALLNGYLNRCLSATDINALLQSITGWYFKRGYISSRAYLAPQDLTTRTLVIQVVEGSIEGIDVEELSPRVLQQLFQPREGLLNLRDIEQGLDQLNRLRSRQSTMELIPGKRIGASRVQLKTKFENRIGGSLAVDNLGQHSTGEDQARINLSFDDPFERLGFFSASYSRQIHNQASDIYSRSASMHFDWPYRYWNVDIDASWLAYSTIINAFSSSFVSSGVSRNQSLRVSRLLFRNQQSKFGLRGTLRRSDSLSLIEGTRVDTSSRTLVSGGFELWHQYYLQAGVWSNALIWQKGLDWFDGEPNLRPVSTDADDSANAQAIPKSEYHKFSLNSSLSLRLPEAWVFNRFRSQLMGQYANVLLFGPDQISVGSAYSVRGFKGAGIASNKGVYLRQDLARAMPISEPSWLGRWFGVTSAELSLGLDGGLTRAVPGESGKYLRVSGRSLSVALTMGDKGSVSFEYAKPLSYPKHLPGFALGPPKNNLYLRGSYVF
jgi:hemolysin activation/secretion protein